MKISRLVASMCLVLGLTNTTTAQSVDEIVKEWERAKAYTKEYLDAMPESGYSLKPKPEMRSFAEQMLHLAIDNYGFTANATGVKIPVNSEEFDKPTDISKANVTKLTMASYDFVIDHVSKMSQSQLDEKRTLRGGGEVTKRIYLFKLFEHQTHHRGQTTVYLRLAGITPPNERLF